MPLKQSIPRSRRFQSLYRKLHALSLIGMNYGGTVGNESDPVAIRLTPDHPVVFDGGANLGSYTQSVLEMRPGATIHAFEPQADTFQALAKRFPTGVHLHQIALSDHNGEASWYTDGPLSEAASLKPQDRSHWEGHNGFHNGGSVATRTVDSVCDEQGIDRIDLLKLDVEGAEIDALRGAGRMLAERRIGLIQFEYGLPAMGARVYLRDFYNLLAGWQIHRVVKDGIVPLGFYQERWEIPCTTNYVAIPT